MTSQEDFEKEARAVGERLALFLVAADLPDDVKSGFTAMISEMSLEQLDRLIKILEANVKDTDVGRQMQQLHEEIMEVQAAYEASRQAGQADVLTKLDEIEQTLKQTQD